MHRVGDVEGWQIPGRYLEFLRGGPAEALAEVARHNDQDVRSLGLAARPHRAPAGRPGGACRGPARRPRRSGPRVHPGATAARGARLSRRRRGPAGRGAGAGSAGDATRPARHVACRRPGDARGRTLVVAQATGRLRRTAAARPAVTVRVRQRAGRGRLDDGADRRRSRPPPAPPRPVRGRGRGLVGAGRRPGSHGRRRRDRAGQDPRASPARSGGGARGRRPRGSARSSAAAGSGRPEPALEADLLRRVARLRSRSLSALGPALALAVFDRLDLRVLARADRQADSFPGTADQDGRPIRDPGQADVLDRERAGGGREAKIRRPSGARPTRRSPVAGRRPSGPRGTCRRRRSDRSPGPWRSAGSGPCRPAPSVPTRSSVPPWAPSVTSRSAPGWRNAVRSARLVPAANVVVAHADQVGPAEQRRRRRGASGDLPARNEVAEHPLPAERDVAAPPG